MYFLRLIFLYPVVFTSHLVKEELCPLIHLVLKDLSYILIWNVLQGNKMSRVCIATGFKCPKWLHIIGHLIIEEVYRWDKHYSVRLNQLYSYRADLRKSGALTIMCWKSSSERRPSLSISASSRTFSHTMLTSSSVSSLRVSLFKVFSRSDLQMKSSLLKSCKWKDINNEIFFFF